MFISTENFVKIYFKRFPNLFLFVNGITKKTYKYKQRLEFKKRLGIYILYKFEYNI